jgi:hypothetical protein
MSQNFTNSRAVAARPVFSRKAVDPLFQFAETARALRFAAARDAMSRAWTQLGGARSPLGLPLHRQIKVEGSADDPFEHCAVFRGGVLTLSDDGRYASVEAIEEVDLSCVGVEWLAPAGARRPLAGVIAAFGPASGSVDVRCFPERGALAAPGGEARLAAFELPLVRGGRMQDYWVWVALVDGAAEDVASAIDGVASRLRRAILNAAGEAGGELAEGLVQRRSFKDSVVEAAVAEAGASHAETAAGRVRVSSPVCLRVHWSALGPRPAAPRPRRESDGHTVIAGWTHRLTVSGDAGSRSEVAPSDDDRCALFLRAETRVERRGIEVEIPGPGTFRQSSRPANE